MEILTSKITVAALKSMAENMFGNLVKAVVDVRLKKNGGGRELADERE